MPEAPTKPPMPPKGPPKARPKARPKPRVYSPHRFLAVMFGTVVANKHFNIDERRLQNAGIAGYRAYLNTIEAFDADESLSAMLNRFEVIEE